MPISKEGEALQAELTKAEAEVIRKIAAQYVQRVKGGRNVLGATTIGFV